MDQLHTRRGRSKFAGNDRKYLIYLAPRDGFEPPTNGLTVRRSTTELPGNRKRRGLSGSRACKSRKQGPISRLVTAFKNFDFRRAPSGRLATAGEPASRIRFNASLRFSVLVAN